MVDPQVVALLGRRRRLAVGQRGHELPGQALATAALDPLDVEVVDGEGEVLHPVGIEKAPRHEVVVLREVVGEAAAHDHDHAALVAEQPTEREPDQHDQHRDVEEQVAGLTEIAALGADRPAAVLPRA